MLQQKWAESSMQVSGLKLGLPKRGWKATEGAVDVRCSLWSKKSKWTRKKWESINGTVQVNKIEQGCQRMIFLIMDAGVSTSFSTMSHKWSPKTVFSLVLASKFRNPDNLCYSKESKLTLRHCVHIQAPPFTGKKIVSVLSSKVQQKHLNALQVTHYAVRAAKEIWGSSHSFGLIVAVLWHFTNLMEKRKAERTSWFFGKAQLEKGSLLKRKQ